MVDHREPKTLESNTASPEDLAEGTAVPSEIGVTSAPVAVPDAPLADAVIGMYFSG